MIAHATPDSPLDLDVQFAWIFVATTVLVMALVLHAQNTPYTQPTLEEVGQAYGIIVMPARPVEPLRDVAEARETPETPAPRPAIAPQPAAATPPSSGGGGPDRPSHQRGLVGILGAKGRDPAIDDVFREGSFEGLPLDHAFRGVSGLDVADRDARAATRDGAGGGEAVEIALDAARAGDVRVGGKGDDPSVLGAVAPEMPEVEGELSPEIIAAEMKRNVRAMKDCYERQLKRTPALAGKLVLGFEIDPEGRARHASVPHDTVGSEALERCILERARTWRFPRPSAGSVQVTFPVVFEPAR